MDDQGWVPITLIANFPRVSFLMIEQFQVLFYRVFLVLC
jgi:hypothetical protein